MKRLDWIIVAVMVIAVLVSVQVYYNMTNNKCIASPLTYAAKGLSEKYGHPFNGWGMFITPGNIRSPQVTFDSNNVTIEYP